MMIYSKDTYDKDFANIVEVMCQSLHEQVLLWQAL